jgi:hypothetical protein
MSNTSDEDTVESRIAEAYVKASARPAQAGEAPKSTANPAQQSVPLMSLKDILEAINTEYAGAFIDEVAFYKSKDGCEAYIDFADATLRLNAVSAFHDGNSINSQEIIARAKEGLYLRQANLDKRFYLLLTDESLVYEVVLMAIGADMMIIGEK